MFSHEYDSREYGDQIRLENEMYTYTNDLRYAFSRAVHPKYVDDMMKLTALMYINGYQEAHDLADKLGVGKLHFLACLDDEENFCEEFIEQQKDNFILHTWEDV
jgi:hypothetical protein